MPENNFEEQAKKLVSHFAMHPRDEVWHNVQKTIDKPRRKRRALLWWWLLPACISMGVYGFLQSKIDKKYNRPQAAITTPAIMHKPITSADAATKETGKAKMAHRAKESQTATIKKQDSVTATYRVVKPKAVLTVNLLPPANLQNEKPGALLFTGANNHHLKKVKPTSEPAYSFVPGNIITGEYDTKAHATAVINANFKTVDLYAFAAKDIKRTDSVTIPSGEKQVIKDTAFTRAKTTQKNKNNLWHFGVMAEAGLSAKKTSFLNFSQEKSTNSSAVTDGSGAIRSVLRNVQQTSAGWAFAFGVTAQRQLGKNVYLLPAISYHYQSIKIYGATYKDTIIVNATNTATIGSYHATQSFHFASLYTGLQWYFFNKNKISIGINAGADNYFLIATRKKIHQISNGALATIPNSNIGFNYPQYLSFSAPAKSDFVSYQPHFFAGAVVNIKMPQTRQIHLSPFVRSAFRPLEKSSTSKGDHIFSAGVQAVYFFK